MKQATLVAVINVSDEFETGKCTTCPFGVKSYFENHQNIQENLSCNIGFTSLSCPLILKHVNRAEQKQEGLESG